MEKVHGQLFRTHMTTICRNIQLSRQQSKNHSTNNTIDGSAEDVDFQAKERAGTELEYSRRPNTKINGRRVNLDNLKFRATTYGRVYKEFDANDSADQELLLYGQRRDSQASAKLPRQRQDENFLDKVLGAA